MRTITQQMIIELIDAAKEAPRKRTMYRLHEHEEPVQRMVNALVPGTYVAPHQHGNPPKVELISILRGHVAVLKFSETGELTEIHHVQEDGPTQIVDIAPGEFHSMVALGDSAVLEIGQGPYVAETHKQFATWAPLEGEDGAADYLRQLETKIRENT